MNFSQITTFHAVMTSRSLSDAANKLGRTQPAVSASIKALEDQLGIALFERRGRKLIPVPEAQYLLAEVSDVLSQMHRVRHTMRSLSAGEAGTLTIAGMPGTVSMIFPRFIAAQLSPSADVSVSLLARTSGQIAELTRAQSVDFAFADAPDRPTTGTLSETEIISADCMVALPQDHPLAAKKVIGIADLDNEPLGHLHTAHAHTKALETAFRDHGAQMRSRVDSQTFLPLLHFVAAGQCCMVMDPLSVFLVEGEDAMVKGVVVRPMAAPVPYHYALYTPGHRPISILAQNLRNKWREEVAQLLQQLGARPIFSR